ncbi:MAG: LamG-like jellyroll fold domain-containing protein [Pirellulaceae bacterium]
MGSLAAIGDGFEIRLYIDGEEVAIGGSEVVEPTPVDSYGFSDFPFNVGGGGVFDGTGNQFTGIIDEVAVWDKCSPALKSAAVCSSIGRWRRRR